MLTQSLKKLMQYLNALKKINALTVVRNTRTIFF